MLPMGTSAACAAGEVKTSVRPRPCGGKWRSLTPRSRRPQPVHDAACLAPRSVGNVYGPTRPLRTPSRRSAKSSRNQRRRLAGHRLDLRWPATRRRCWRDRTDWQESSISARPIGSIPKPTEEAVLRVPPIWSPWTADTPVEAARPRLGWQAPGSHAPSPRTLRPAASARLPGGALPAPAEVPLE